MVRFNFTITGILCISSILAACIPLSEEARLQVQMIQAGKWMPIAENDKENYFYDPFSLSQDADGAWIYNLGAWNKSGTLRTRGPNTIKLDCKNNTIQDIIYLANKNPDKSNANSIPIMNGTIGEVMKNRLCGMTIEDDRFESYPVFWAGSGVSNNIAVSYWIKNNEVFIDPGDKNIRSAKAIFRVEKDNFNTRINLSVNCESKQTRAIISQNNKVLWDWSTVNENDLSIGLVIFDKLCNDSRKYIRKISQVATSKPNIKNKYLSRKNTPWE